MTDYCDGCGQPTTETAFCGICAQEWEDYQREKNT